MKISAEDFKQLRTALFVFLMAVTSVSLVVYFTKMHEEKTLKNLLIAKRNLLEARRNFRESGTEKNNIARYLPKHQLLVSQGFIGEERRIEWVDALRNVHKNNKLFSIKYDIGAQGPYTTEFLSNPAPFKIFYSPMKIEFAMLHEVDLLRLLSALSKAQSTVFIARECEIWRLNSEISKTLAPNLQCKCALDWITIREPLLGKPVLQTTAPQELM